MNELWRIFTTSDTIGTAINTLLSQKELYEMLHNAGYTDSEIKTELIYINTVILVIKMAPFIGLFIYKAIKVIHYLNAAFVKNKEKKEVKDAFKRLSEQGKRKND